MKLYGLPFSPYTMRVVLAARIKGHDLTVEKPLGGGMYGPEFQAISPMGRIPLFEDADGWRLSESGAIVAYLDDMLDGPALFPADPRGRARAREMIAVAEIELGGGLRHFALQRMFRMVDQPAQFEYGCGQVALALSTLERIGLGASPWALGDTPGAVDCVLIPNLVFADLMTAHFDGGAILHGHAGVQAYWARAKADPLGQIAAETMSRIVPVLAARRAAQA